MENKKAYFDRLTPYFSPSVLRRIELSYILAKYAHRTQVRKELGDDGQPLRYFEHVRRVALTLIDEAKCVRPEMIEAANLHDAFEDSETITPELVEEFLGSDTCSIVKVLSKNPKEGYADRLLVCTDWRPLLIKACDRLDNLRSLKDASQEFQIKQLTETRDVYLRVFDRMVVLTPEIYRDGARQIRHEIQKCLNLNHF